MPDPKLISHFYVKINGTDASTALMDSVKQIRVDSSLHMPAMATIELYDSKLEWVDSSDLAIGADIEIQALGGLGDATTTTIFSGKIAAQEPEFVSNQEYCVMVIRAYDRLHFLHRGNVSKTFTQVADSAIVSAVLTEHGLRATVQATSELNEHFFRGDLSSYDLLQFLARRNGYVVVAEGTTVFFKPPESLGRPTVVAEYGVNLVDFRPTLTSAGQVNELTVDSWNIGTAKLISGKASSPTFVPTATGNKRGPALAQAASSAAAKFHISDAVGTVGAANALAKALLNRVVAGDLVAEGRIVGNSKLAAGGKLTIQKVGTNFSGTYLVSRVQHVLNAEEGYYTDFWLGGMNSETVSNLLKGPASHRAEAENAPRGLMVGVVTDNKDVGDYGRVKVKFPALTEKDNSWWAPVASIGGGSGRGFMVTPEIDDQVIVAFANGDLNQPVVLGGLWGGNGKAPVPTSKVIASGAVDVREFKTRVGHVLRFTEKDAKIEIIDKTGNNKLTITAQDNSFTIDCKGPMTINAGQDVKINAGGNANVEAKANVMVKGVSVSVEASGKLSLKGAMVEIAGSGMVKISGAMVNIN